MRELVTREFGNLEKVIPVLIVLLAQFWLRLHVDGAVLGLALALGRADRDAQPAPGAIFRRHLQRVFQLRKFAPLGDRRLEAFGSVIDSTGIIDLGANDGMRTNHDAFAALD